VSIYVFAQCPASAENAAKDDIGKERRAVVNTRLVTRFVSFVISFIKYKKEIVKTFVTSDSYNV
jgi:hypothetical protein